MARALLHLFPKTMRRVHASVGLLLTSLLLVGLGYTAPRRSGPDFGSDPPRSYWQEVVTLLRAFAS